MEIPEALRKRIAEGKRWLAEVQDESPDQLAARLKEYEEALNASLEGLSDEQWAYSPAEDQWSIREVCLHVTNSVRGVAMLTNVLAAGKDGPDTIVMSVKDEDGGASTEEIRAMLKKAFQRSAEATLALSDGFNAEKTTEHPFFGALNCKEWAVFNLMHVSIHIQQIERIKSDANFPK